MTCAVAVLAAAASDTVDLSGSWEFGYGPDRQFTDSIMLPGSMLTNGKGHDVDASTRWTGSLYDLSYYHSDRLAPYRREGNIKFPFFLTPDKTYVGKAYYRRRVRVPREWAGRRVTLFLERPHIETTVRIDGAEAGHDMSLSVPHEYDITPLVTPGRECEIEITVYNGTENVGVGQDSHSVSDQTQGNWNGIAGCIELRSAPKGRHIRKVRVYPDVKARRAHVRVATGGTAAIGRARARAFDASGAEVCRSEVSAMRGDTLLFDLDIGPRMQTWDEFSPSLYRLEVSLGGDTAVTTFGMRDFTIEGRDFLVNGRKTYIRGTVECCCFPLTGYPPTDEAPWDTIFARCREYGINMMRFHSYCPPEAAFAAADRAGIYLQPEGPTWPNHGVKLGDGMAIDRYLLEESERIVDSYGNHPSFVMMAAGNEPAGRWVEYCRDWVAHMKRYDPTKVYCGASVGGGWEWDYGSEYHVKGGARGLAWSRTMPSSDDDYTDAITRPRHFVATAEEPVNTRPFLSHEQGQWCAFPDLKETVQYTGPYKARNFEIFADLLAENGMEGLADTFLMASGRLQALCYKYEIERNLRTPGYSGFQLLGLNDYSGQGTAIEGVLNVFWRVKGYIDGSAWRQFCSEVVPLARFPKFVFTSDEELRVPVEVVNASAATLKDPFISYRITDSYGKTFAAGSLTSGNIPVGKNFEAGTVKARLRGVYVPRHFTLTVEVGDFGRNSWEFWVYPPEEVAAVPDGIHMTDTLDSRALDVLRRGGKVLLTAAGRVTLGSDVVQHYLPVFWNTSWFKMRPPHTTGARIDRSHPLFAHGFPTDSWGNLNWWELLNRAQVMNLSHLPAWYQSPVQPIDTWHVSRKLGMIVEARVLGGTLLMTTMDISTDLDRRVVARRMRGAILHYMSSADFAPALRLEPADVARFFTDSTPPVEMYTDESPDELMPKFK